MKRKIAAILAADIAGYSRLVAENEEETISRLGSYREVFDALISQYGGRIFNTAGDAVMAEFPSTVEAVRCAVDVQEALKTRNLAFSADRQMHFRIGISVADVIERNGDLLGDGVNIAARLEGLAAPGGICVSRSVYEQVSNKAAIQFSDIGEQMVKNIPTPVHAYRVADSGQESTGSPIRISSPMRFPPMPVLAAGAAGIVLIVGFVVWALRPTAPSAPSAPDAPVAARPSPQAVAVPPAGAAAPLSAGTGPVARLTLLTPPAGSSCQAQVMEPNPRFVETAVELTASQPVLDIDAPALCGLAIAGSGGTSARFGDIAQVGAMPSLSSSSRLVFNPTGAGQRLPAVLLSGGPLDRIELRRK